jgi:hypothetical protein
LWEGKFGRDFVGFGLLLLTVGPTVWKEEESCEKEKRDSLDFVETVGHVIENKAWEKRKEGRQLLRERMACLVVVGLWNICVLCSKK